MLLERAEHIKKDWHLLLQAVIKQYNRTIHDSTKLKPVDAIQEKCCRSLNKSNAESKI